MAGHGQRQVTTQNLTVHSVDADKGLLLIKGAVPGPIGSLSSSRGSEGEQQ